MARNMVFIDSRVADYPILASGLGADTAWVLLDAGEDGVLQMRAALANYRDLDSIHIVSHGSAGALYLGSAVLDSNNLGRYLTPLQAIGQSLAEDGDILLYGCNAGAGETGWSFVSALALATGADVAASTGLTGNAMLGGNWRLESATGTIQADTLNADIAGILAVFDGTSGNDTLFVGTTANDTINGLAGDDDLWGYGGNDTLNGGDGNDYLIGDAGNDILDGGAGVDGADYLMATVGVAVSLALTTQQNTGGAGLDTLSNIENLYGGDSDDTLAGDALDNTLHGNDGNDTLNGGDGNDILQGNAGNDILDGGAGVDAADYWYATAGVTVSLALTAQQNTAGDGLDTLSNMEDLYGSNFNDALAGNALDNTLMGNGGNDTLTGAGGSDVFYFDASGSGIDTITDFSDGDCIRINGAAFSGAVAAGDGSAVLANQIQFAATGGITTLYIGADSIAGADIQIQLAGEFSANNFLPGGNQVQYAIASGQLNIDALLCGTKWDGATGNGASLSFSFPWANNSAPYWQAGYSPVDNEPATGSGLNAVQQEAARAALQSWANVANIQFTELAEAGTQVGDFRFAWSAALPPDAWGWSTNPDSAFAEAGDVWINSGSTPPTQTDGWSPGAYNYEALIHEAGHGLGLKHPGDYSGAATGGQQGPFLPADLDNALYSVMSYNSPANDAFATLTPDGSWYADLFYVSPETPMVLDIAAMQYLYGANTTYHAGNDAYTFDAATPFFKTIWDAGGTDTISVSNFSQACVVDLTPGNYSSIRILPPALPAGVVYPEMATITYDGANNLGIAYGAIIENAIGGSGSDTLTGNDTHNSLEGGAGDDIINGGAGIDIATYSAAHASYTLTKTSGGHTVSGGADGSDTLANIERLRFADVNLALDVDGNAGTAAKILGAVFGAAAVSNQTYMGIGLDYLDGGMSYADLMALALNAAGATTSNAVVARLWGNLFGAAPSAAEAAPYVAMLDSGSYNAGALGVLAADTSLNAANINLVGLAQTGIEFV